MGMPSPMELLILLGCLGLVGVPLLIVFVVLMVSRNRKCMDQDIDWMCCACCRAIIPGERRDVP